MLFTDGLIYLLLAAAALASIKAGKLTLVAGITGFIISLLILTGAGLTGIVMLATFFLLGTTATSWGMRYKQQFGLAEKNKGKRTAGQVLANAGVAASVGLISYGVPQHRELFELMMAGSFASATADTISSELGNRYGKRFYNVLSGKKDIRGLDGVVSVEGTLAGVVGSASIAMVYATGHHQPAWIAPIIIAGTAGNLVDSVLGATLERKNFLNNNTVNFLNTAAGALVALVFYFLR